MARPTLSDVHPTNAALANISVGYKNSLYIAEQVFPVVTVQKKSDFYFIYSKDFWFRNRAGVRAPGALAPRADYGLTTASYVCTNKALAYAIPDEMRENADAPLQPDVEAVEFITDGLLIDQEISVADIITGSTDYWANTSTPGTQWSSDTSDPFGDIAAGISNVIKAIGRKPNVAVTSWDVWQYLINHPDFIDRVKYTRPSGKLEAGDLQTWFEFDKVLIGTQIYDSSQEGTTANQDYIWKDDFWMGYVPTSPGLRTPSAGYILRWGNRSVEKHREAQNHQDVYEIQHYTTYVVTASDAGHCIYNAV